MFTGIIEATAIIEKIEGSGENINFTLNCPFTQELKIDQSLAHNGCCLTVVEITDQNYSVTAIAETLENCCFAQKRQVVESCPPESNTSARPLKILFCIFLKFYPIFKIVQMKIFNVFNSHVFGPTLSCAVPVLVK